MKSPCRLHVTKVDNMSIKNSSECGNLLPTSPNLQINVHIKLHVVMDLCAFHWTYRSGQLYELTSRYPLSENSCRYKILSEKWLPHTRYTVNCETLREQYWNNDTAWSYIADIYDQEELDENDLLLGVQLHVFNIANKNEVHYIYSLISLFCKYPPPPLGFKLHT